MFPLQVTEPLPSTLRGGNLSVLKKHWEQQQPSSCRTQSTSYSHTSPKPAHNPPKLSSTLVTTTRSEDQDTETSHVQPEDLSDMEAKPSSGSEGGVADIEKPSVPLTSLKMMFETGENLTNKASL